MIVIYAGWDAVDAATSSRAFFARGRATSSPAKPLAETGKPGEAFWRRRVAAYGEVVWS
jgi:hypothetical protein